MPYPKFLIGELLHKDSDLIILDKRDDNKKKGELAEPINTGATGEVWRVKQADIIDRAVKILSPEKPLLKRDNWKYFVEVFEKEMRKLAFLTHSHLAKLISFGRIPPDEVKEVNTEGVGIPYIVMEYVKGVPIHKFIIEQAKKTKETGAFEESVNLVVDLFNDVLSALQYMHHQGALHSDVKETKGKLKAPDPLSFLQPCRCDVIPAQAGIQY